MLTECFLPKFRYREKALTAKQIFRRFTKEFFFLPDCTSEPNKLGLLIQKLIYRQRGLKIRPPKCPRHDITMVKLGHYGRTHLKPKAKLSMATLSQVGNGGGLFVANGICRCPHPGCFFVASIESSATIHAEVD